MTGIMVISLAAMLLIAGTPSATAKPNDQIKLSSIVSKLLDDPVITPAQRRSLAIFHGQWDRLDDPTRQEQAQIAMQRYDLANPLFNDNDVPAVLRGRAALARGAADEVVQILEDHLTARGALVKAKALEDLGQTGKAVVVLTPLREQLTDTQTTDAQELTAVAEAIMMLARLEGRPAGEYALAMSLLGNVREELDPLYWPAFVAEAKALIEKDNIPEAGDALREALRLNPQCSIAWYLLGRLALGGFDFAKADHCGRQLRRINDQHILADLLAAESLLTQKDAQTAQSVIEAALERYPQNRQMLALLAAAYAMTFNQSALQTVLTRFEQLSPRGPLAHFTAGRFLSAGRQYATGETMLRTAIQRGGNWPQPRIELGLLMMQRGDETAALTELGHAVRLDPFNRRANNQLKLAQELTNYAQIQTEHFQIRFRPGIDQILARDMTDELERIYRHLTGAFGYRPPNRTMIEILPDEKRFAVRITGMPDIWTVAACTGDVIAMTPPRIGTDLSGTFDWVRVIQHEFVHTITLNQTHYRIPHWFTEGCAVSQEPGERPYQECVLLARSLAQDGLFDLNEINWAFVRPKTPEDRPLAYAQAGWMVEYLTMRYGFPVIVKMLELYRDGATDAQAIHGATGHHAEQLMDDFKGWANTQIHRWGLQPHPDHTTVKQAMAVLRPPDQLGLDRLLAQYPDHPDLLRVVANRAMTSASPEEARLAVLQYAAARPVDPWSDQQMVKLALATGRPQEAIGSLEELDRQEDKTGTWAHQLAQIHRAAGRLDAAANAARRALYRQPYNPTYRELAATIDVQAGQLQSALDHLKSLAMLEPDRSIHQIRLAALYQKMGRADQASTAAKAARMLDPAAPVESYLAQ